MFLLLPRSVSSFLSEWTASRVRLSLLSLLLVLPLPPNYPACPRYRPEVSVLTSHYYLRAFPHPALLSLPASTSSSVFGDVCSRSCALSHCFAPCPVLALCATAVCPTTPNTSRLDLCLDTSPYNTILLSRHALFRHSPHCRQHGSLDTLSSIHTKQQCSTTARMGDQQCHVKSISGRQHNTATPTSALLFWHASTDCLSSEPSLTLEQRPLSLGPGPIRRPDRGRRRYAKRRGMATEQGAGGVGRCNRHYWSER